MKAKAKAKGKMEVKTTVSFTELTDKKGKVIATHSERRYAEIETDKCELVQVIKWLRFGDSLTIKTPDGEVDFTLTDSRK